MIATQPQQLIRPQITEVHDADQLVLKYQESYYRRSFLGIKWSAPEKQKDYLDIFNNIAGMRTILETTFRNDIKAYVDDLDQIQYLDIHGSDYTREAILALKSVPTLRDDFELCIRTLFERNGDEIKINILSANMGDTHYLNEQNPTSTYSWHKDTEDSAYIQIGGACLEYIEETTTPDITRLQLSERFKDIYPERLNVGDIFIFPPELIHRGPQFPDIYHQGRLAILFHP